MNVLEEKRSSPQLRDYVKKRIEGMQAIMARKGVDVTILMRPENVFYFSNFNPILISHVPYFILTQDDAFLLVHCIRHDHAVNEGAVDKVLCYGKWGATKAVAMDAMDAMRELLGDKPLTVGVEGDYASMNVLNRLKDKLNVRAYVDIAQDAVDLRLIKDPHEIQMCRISGELVDLGVTRAIEALEAGASEAQAATQGQYAMRQLWHEKYQQYEVSGFSNSETADIDTLVVWCMSNERLNYGCDCPTGYVPMPGDLTMPMSWARVAGYNVENERTVMVGRVNDERLRAYNAMLKARDQIFKLLRPGTIFEDLYFAAMKEYEDAGFGAILPGRCGHGMGLSTHEFPSVTKGNKAPLAPGMVFTVEPGLMSAELGAVRNSDTVLITEDGFEFLTKSRRDTIIIKG
ncbi:M24 family metallopeptidase [Lawsonibacter sp. LCP25S3_G6]|uniref:M24 family metallopeptidase n=1 Tax=unclassified Lawsonibacter TaxID=2617946 RepID=UPI003F97B604